MNTRLAYGCKMTILGLLILCGSMTFQIPTPGAGDGGVYFVNLKMKLIADGFSREVVENLYNRPKVKFDAKGVSNFFTYRESRLNYGQFLSHRSLRNAGKYIDRHEEHLILAEKRYGVDRYVITAIILVETKLGTYLGNRSIFNTLSTMASLSDAGVRQKLWDQIPKKRRISPEKFETKADVKSRWAYTELKAFLTHAAREKIDPLSINGSFAGAMGIAQFMPSNVLAHARDGNGDGRVDLFDHADAIFSIANYLKNFGWHPAIEREKSYNVLLRYNYSKYYVNTILSVAERLRG
jgi:membrane-bound lytic murein transglycosylase B